MKHALKSTLVALIASAFCFSPIPAAAATPYTFRIPLWGSVAGQGANPSASLSANVSSLSYPGVYTNGTSSLSFLLTNSGPGTASTLAFNLNSPFSQTNNCGTTLASGAQCRVLVVFAPTLPLTSSASLNIASGNSSVTVSLTGTGLAAQPIFSSLTFGTVPVGNSSSASVTLTNSGNLDVTSWTIGTSSDTEFVQTNNCPTTISSGSSCTITVTFAPTSPGSKTGRFTLTSPVHGGSSTFSVQGTGG